MRYRHVLWDFDGTLADTLASLVELYDELGVRHGFRPIGDPQAVRGLTPFEFLRQHDIPLLQVPFLVRTLRAAQHGLMPTTRLFPGLMPVLHTLRRSGCGMGVLSSNSRENILACLQANQAEHLFDTVVGYSRLLGKARPIRRAVRKAGLAGREVLYVGDEVRDIAAARQAGVAVAAVTWGFNDRELLARQEPDHLIEQPEEILQVMEL